MGLHRAQGIFVHLTQETNGRSGGNEGMDILASDRAAIDRRKDQFELLSNDTFDLQELVFILLAELLASRHGHKGVELLPAFQIALHAQDELFHITFAHKTRASSWLALR